MKLLKSVHFLLTIYSLISGTNVLGEKLEELYCLDANADREEKMLNIGDDDFARGTCHNCNNYSMFIFYDKESYPTRFYCTSCPHERSEIEIEDFRECPECGTNSLVYDENLLDGICLWYKCPNHRDGGVLIDMEYCDECNDYKIEEVCDCNRDI
jgi:hypothetical protein